MPTPGHQGRTAVLAKAAVARYSPSMTAPLLVFDLDGTLVDSAADLLATLDAVLAKHGFTPLADRRVRDGIGYGARHLIEFGLQRRQAEADEATIDRMHRDFIAYYEANICVESRLFPGSVELLDRFAVAGWRFAVCTNKQEHLSRHVLAALGVGHRFATVCGGDTFENRKPHPAHLLGTIAAADGSQRHAVMVGDSHVDRDTARNAGVPFVGVTFGYTPVPMAELGADLLIDSFDELDPRKAAELLMRARAVHRGTAATAAAIP